MIRLEPAEAQRLLLEIAVRLSLTNERFKGWTHLRYSTNDGWHLLDADANEMRREKRVLMGEQADACTYAARAPFPHGDTTRLTIQFSPPKLTIDVLASDNTPIHSSTIIDVQLEERIRKEITHGPSDRGH